MDYSNLPCYGLLLCSVIVTATKVAQRGSALLTSMSVLAHCDGNSTWGSGLLRALVYKLSGVG